MNEYSDLPSIPGYVSIKEAAKLLGISEKTVYFYIEKRRLPAKRAADVIMISLDDLEKFKLQPVGRPRKNTPPWRASAGDNMQSVIIIHVQIRNEQKSLLENELENIRRNGNSLFPGTVVRSISRSETEQGQVIIVLVWRRSVMPDEKSLQEELETFRQELADVLDWSTAKYEEGTVLMHT
jgi:excisionase family DNA binding protein